MRLTDLTIPIGQQLSNEIDVSIIEDATFYGPAALTGTVSVQVSPDGVNWFASGTVITAVTRTALNPIHARLLRLSSDMAEAAERVVPVFGSDKKIA